MTYQNTHFYIYISMVMVVNFVTGHGSHLNKKHKNYLTKNKNQYGDAYGTEWIYFPDGDEVPHYVNLTAPITGNMSYSRGTMNNDIEYKLYTRKNIEIYTVMNEFGQPLNESDDVNIVLSDAPLKVITHGWKSNVEKPGLTDIIKAYLHTREVNVITVDWRSTADSIFYHWVANQTFSIGTEIALFLKSLNKHYNVSGNQIHLIGHSLGAHVMGIAGSYSNLTVSRITGLDPARPLFEYPSRDIFAKLDSSDAEFVDVIHTCGGLLGIEEPIGTADFYPNKGIPPQPGCNSLQKIIEACSHGRAIYYFAESIETRNSFQALQCKGWNEYIENRCEQHGFMGEGANRNMTGKFFLKTSPIKPFGFGRT